jgi:hypothetical protein
MFEHWRSRLGLTNPQAQANGGRATWRRALLKAKTGKDPPRNPRPVHNSTRDIGLLGPLAYAV